MRFGFVVVLCASACGGRTPEPRTARRVAALPLIALLPDGIFGVLRIDMEEVPASTEPSTDPNKMPFEVSGDLTEAVVGFVEGPETRSLVLLRGDLDRADLRREIEAGERFLGNGERARWGRHRGCVVVRVSDYAIYDLGGGTWVWTADDALADEVLDVATGRRPPRTLPPAVREVADLAHLDESVFSLALVATDGLRDGIREVGYALGSDAGDRLAGSLKSVAVSVRGDEPFEWEVVADSTGPEGAREIAAVATDAGLLVSGLLGAVGIDLGRLHPRVVIDGGRFVISGEMDTWTNRFEWTRPGERQVNPNVI